MESPTMVPPWRGLTAQAPRPATDARQATSDPGPRTPDQRPRGRSSAWLADRLEHLDAGEIRRAAGAAARGTQRSRAHHGRTCERALHSAALREAFGQGAGNGAGLKAESPLPIVPGTGWRVFPGVASRRAARGDSRRGRQLRQGQRHRDKPGHQLLRWSGKVWRSRHMGSPAGSSRVPLPADSGQESCTVSRLRASTYSSL
jgi:hypothetical protein